MEDIVYEIIGGALILGIILVVILVFRNGSDAVKEAANSQMQSDVKIEQTIGVEGAVYGPSKIAEAIKYSAVADIKTEVCIQSTSGSITVQNASFNPNTYPNRKYKLDIQYYSSNTVTSANLLPDTNTQTAVLVRFLFIQQP